MVRKIILLVEFQENIKKKYSNFIEKYGYSILEKNIKKNIFFYYKNFKRDKKQINNLIKIKK